ncbi:uncharacterized protein DS421_2g40640 [Arachis hypogaea]|nr:uncharacterized protein DS421_2g40640 [Arachis hypogaea]
MCIYHMILLFVKTAGMVQYFTLSNEIISPREIFCALRSPTRSSCYFFLLFFFYVNNVLA